MPGRLRLVAFAALVAGLALRTIPLLLAPGAPLETCDGRAYHDLGVALAEGQGFYVADPQLAERCLGLIDIGPSHHFAPALPLIEGLFVRLFGDSALALVLPLLLVSWAAVAVVWWTTRDLFGPSAGLIAGAAVSLEWSGAIYGTFLGYSENLVVLAMTVTLWAIVRCLGDDRFMLVAGLFAGLGYLSKASIGWFFLVAGAGGLAYRLAFRGWSVLRNGWYWGAIALFAVPVVTWSYRNLSLFWDGTLLGLTSAWQTSDLHARIVAQALGEPGQLVLGLAGKLPLLAGVMLLPFVPLLPAFRSPLRRWKEEDALGLWLAVGLIFGLGWFFAATFWVYLQGNVFWADHARYVSPAQVPLLWLLLRDGRPSTRAWSLSFLILLGMCFLMPFLVMRNLPLGP